MTVSTTGVKVAATKSRQHLTLALQMALDRQRAGRELAALRESRQLTQAQIVDATGLSLRQVQRYEAGESMPRWKNLDKLAEVLGPPVYEIVRDEGEQAVTTPGHPLGVGDDERLARIEAKLDALLEDAGVNVSRRGLAIGGPPVPAPSTLPPARSRRRAS